MRSVYLKDGWGRRGTRAPQGVRVRAYTPNPLCLSFSVPKPRFSDQRVLEGGPGNAGPSFFFFATIGMGPLASRSSRKCPAI